MAEPRSDRGTTGADTSPPWRLHGYPDEEAFARITNAHPEHTYDADKNTFVHFLGLPPWVRLGWPDLRTWAQVKTLPIGKKSWRDLAGAYEVAADFERVMRFWPDCHGQPLVDVALAIKGGIRINRLTYGPGRHRVPQSVAVELRRIDQAAGEEWINQFIPKVHRDRVIVLNGVSGAVEGEIR